MKTTDKTIAELAEIRECFRLMGTTGDPCGHMARFVAAIDVVSADLTRLRAIEAARAKGGLDPETRSTFEAVAAGDPPPVRGAARYLIRVDDALRSTTEELARCRELLRGLHRKACIHDKVEVYLAETEVRDA